LKTHGADRNWIVFVLDNLRQAGGPLFAIELGRRDGLTSYAFSASTNIPPGTLKLDGLMESFLNVGLDQTDLVALSGAHPSLN